METLKAILTRRSIRHYSEKTVDKEIVEKILTFGMYAPSATNKQPWHFIILNDRKTLNLIADFHPNAKMLKEAQYAILVCGDELKAHDKKYWPVDCGAATQNMLLAAHDLGLGACWLGVYPREERIERIKEIIPMPNHVFPFSLISIGYAANIPAIPDRVDNTKIHWNKW